MKRSKSTESKNLNEQLLDNVVDSSNNFFEAVVDEVFVEKRSFFVHSIAQKLKELELSPAASAEHAEEEREWVQIESLSRLRSIVGGRFQNLKQRWVAAGLPLKKHRGDQVEEFEVSEEGWLELSTWILDQGYEVRVSGSKTTSLLELRPLS
jgi:hypothetical protein